MSDPGGEVPVVRCPSCKGVFSAPRRCCPRCGQLNVVPGTIAATGVVLASTELSIPPTEFPSPHALILVELAEGLRVLVPRSGAAPPPPGTEVIVRSTGAGYSIA
jgi:uncharacterized OB-fold protein